jgi:hypothetical protein
MMTIATVWHFFSLVDAVLSQNTVDHSDDLFQTNSSSFDQARCQLNVQHGGWVKAGFTAINSRFTLTCSRWGVIAAGI